MSRRDGSGNFERMPQSISWGGAELVTGNAYIIWSLVLSDNYYDLEVEIDKLMRDVDFMIEHD